MNNKVLLLMLVSMVFLVLGTSSAQIILDGDSTDWQMEPVLVQSVHNVDVSFPAEVKATTTDVVDVKDVKAVVYGSVLYTFMRFWGGPAWPNEVYEEVFDDGNTYKASRGYYHLMLDLDNNITTGWDNRWYEGHYTPVGYLADNFPGQGFEQLGAEAVIYVGLRNNYPVENDGVGGVKPRPFEVRDHGYEATDASEYIGKPENDVFYDLAASSPTVQDSARMMAWEGSLLIGGSDDPNLAADSLLSYYFGHAWAQGDTSGNDFLEFAYDLEVVKKYFAGKGMDYIKAGDQIGISAFIETPAEDWSIDVTTRGHLTLPDMPARPGAITFDGDSSDWADVPTIIESVHNVDVSFPAEVKATTTDNVDVRSVKTIVAQDALYAFIRFWGGPAWPNNVYEEVFDDGNTYNASRGYYHLMLDLDNNITTGWDNRWYEGHYTPVGYLADNFPGQGFDQLGAEAVIYIGQRNNYPVENDGLGGVKPRPYEVRSHDYAGTDASEYIGKPENDVFYDMFEMSPTDPDSADGMQYDGKQVFLGNDHIAAMNGIPDWSAHAWGEDFLELGIPIKPIKDYYMAKSGANYFQPGDMIGVSAFIETPAEDWSIDCTTRGETSVVTGINDGNLGVVAEEFALENNYPNPFNPSTTIEFSVPMASEVTLFIYNTLGQKVRTLVDKNMPNGKHSVVWNGRNDAGHTLPTGLYFYTLRAENTSLTKKMLLIK